MFVPILSLVILCIAALIVSYVLLPLKKVNSYKQPGVSTYFFPLLGHFVYLDKSLKDKGDIWANSKEPRKHGADPKFMVTNFGKTPLFVLEGPKYVKEFLLKPNLYQKSPMMDSMTPLAGTGLVAAEGETWKRHRKIISSSFNFEFLKSNIDVIQNITKEFFDKLSPEELKNYSAISKIQEITGEIVGRIFFGENLNSYTLEGKSLTLALAEISSEIAITGTYLSFVIFGPKVFKYPIIPTYRKIMNRVTNFRNICFKIIQDRKSKPEVKGNDLLSSLLETQKSEDVEKRFSDEDIVNEFITFFIAGMDTTGHLIGMTIYNLSQYPEYLTKLQQERDETYNSKEQPLTTDTLSKMELLHAIFKETLRFYTPAPLIFYREVLQDHEILDLKLKKGDLIVPDFLSAAFEERNFENAKQFKPERWLTPETKTDPYAFVPFSAGPRNCIGQHLAIMEAKVILSEFLERFDFDLKEGYKLRMSFTFLYEPEQDMKFTLRPKITA